MLRDDIYCRSVDRIDEIVQHREKTEYHIREYRDLAIARQRFTDAVLDYQGLEQAGQDETQLAAAAAEIRSLAAPILLHAQGDSFSAPFFIKKKLIFVSCDRGDHVAWASGSQHRAGCADNPTNAAACATI